MNNEVFSKIAGAKFTKFFDSLCRFVLRSIYQQDDNFLVSVRYWNIASQTLRVNDIFPKSHLSKYELLPCRIMTKLEQRLPSGVCKFQLHLSLLYEDICKPIISLIFLQ